jgi:hypothetical protein
VIGLKALETGVDRIENVPAGQADVVPPWPHSHVDLGRQDDILSGHIQVSECLPQCALAVALRVHVSGVEEVDAAF